MKKIVISGVIIALGIYFALSLYVLPEQYMQRSLLESEANLLVEVSEVEISLGESFEVDISSENTGDLTDVLLTSIAFPHLEKIDERIKIVNYDFTQSPVNIEAGVEIGAEYLATQESVIAQYASIEAYSRNAQSGDLYHMTLVITPEQVGEFVFYTKSITLPHMSELSHFPRDGQLDHSREYVEVYSVKVNP